MRIETVINLGSQTVHVDVDFDDIRATIAEAFGNADGQRSVVRCLNDQAAFLKAVDPNLLNEAQRKVVSRFLAEQAKRFEPEEPV